MGGCFDTRTYKINDRKKIEKEWAEAVSCSRSESGESYSGAIGMLGPKIGKWHDRQFDTKRQAEEWLSEHHADKWGPAFAVSFKLPKELTAEQVGRAKVAEATASKLANEFRALTGATLAAIKAAGRYVRCPLCGSSLATAKLTSIRCVFCPGKNRNGRVDIYDDAGYLTTEEQQAKLEEAAKAAFEAAKVAEELRKPQPSNEIGWLVGGWCSS
jgi:hypothetical protein